MDQEYWQLKGSGFEFHQGPDFFVPLNKRLSPNTGPTLDPVDFGDEFPFWTCVCTDHSVMAPYKDNYMLLFCCMLEHWTEMLVVKVTMHGLPVDADCKLTTFNSLPEVLKLGRVLCRFVTLMFVIFH